MALSFAFRRAHLVHRRLRLLVMVFLFRVLFFLLLVAIFGGMFIG
jgi:hypothetical protein